MKDSRKGEKNLWKNKLRFQRHIVLLTVLLLSSLSGAARADGGVASVTPEQLRLGERPCITLVGEQFGDYHQAIIMRLDSIAKPAAEGSNAS